MERYANRCGDSNVVAYEAEQASIKVQFGDGSIYLYTSQSAGAKNLEQMKQLARESLINERFGAF